MSAFTKREIKAMVAAEERLLHTIAEVAEILRVSRRTVYREVAAGHIRTVRVRGRVLVTSRELDAYVAAIVRAA